MATAGTAYKQLKGITYEMVKLARGGRVGEGGDGRLVAYGWGWKVSSLWDDGQTSLRDDGWHNLRDGEAPVRITRWLTV